jgi:ABC-type glycerol-3-phosphate transport system substrate-binding protein
VIAAVPAPPGPPGGSPLVIESFTGVALTVAAHHHVTPVNTAAAWLILAFLAYAVVRLVRR